MRYLSLFSGIEAATVAWHPLGWEPVAFAEIEPFACAVLAHHYPHVPNLGDVTQITDARIEALGPIDVVVGGSPCQDLSVAGKRKGLAGPHSRLFHEQMRIFHAARRLCGARWLVWENVPGVFSSHQGRDFAIVVSSMAGCEISPPEGGWGTEGVALGENGLVEWSVLDAQWFGVAQRRRRVFAVLDTGDWTHRPPILLEPDRLRGDSPPSRKARQDIAPCLSARTQGGGGLGTDVDLDGGLILAKSIPSGLPSVAMCLNAGGMGRLDAESETLIPTFEAGLAAMTHAVHGTQDPRCLMEQAHTLGRNHGQENAILSVALRGREGGATAELGEDVAGCLRGCDGGSNKPHVLAPIWAIQAGATRTNPASGTDGVGIRQEVAYTLEARSEVQAVGLEARVRRLTPRECERLQGFPDDYTRIPWKVYQKARRQGGEASLRERYEALRAQHGEGFIEQAYAECPDGPRYKALGNSMAVPVMRWIGERIEAAVSLDMDRDASER
ncbi:MAG: DNA cytosine methyltransferase [Gammaproteobacteria bacterium]|nr:DNA cytosine methyltransferase [Gammaproteobacteria bacterium]